VLRDSEDEETYYYGIIKEIVQLKYIGEPRKQLVLFNYQWFYFERNSSVKVHKEYYDLVDVHHCKRYLNYDLFILATNVIQLYYMSYPQEVKEKVNW